MYSLRKVFIIDWVCAECCCSLLCVCRCTSSKSISSFLTATRPPPTSTSWSRTGRDGWNTFQGEQMGMEWTTGNWDGQLGMEWATGNGMSTWEWNGQLGMEWATGSGVGNWEWNEQLGMGSCANGIQLNLSTVDTIGTQRAVLYKMVSLILYAVLCSWDSRQCPH